MNKYFTLMVAVLLASACTTKTKYLEVTRYKTFDCPPVRSCETVHHNIVTNRDLALAYNDARYRVAQCRVSVNTLRSCIANNNKIIEEYNAKIDEQIKELGGEVVGLKNESIKNPTAE